MADIEKGGDHSGHDHSGHDHSGHNHAGHSHGTENKNTAGKNPEQNGQKKKKKNFIHNQAFSSFVVIFTATIPTLGVILQFFWLNASLKKEVSLKENEFEYYMHTILMLLMYGMAMWAYYNSITIKNDPVSRPSPPPDTRDMDPIYKNAESCKQCNKWKPARTHHCSMCNRCTLKMDHHCPWVANCVGLRNHRAFFLFTMYLMTGALQYCWRSCVYFQELYYSDDFFSNSSFFYILWTFTSVVIFPTGMLLFFLLSYQSLLVFANQTTIESMGTGPNMCCLPQARGQPLTTINVFDRGCLANVAWFFDYSLFTWWMPFENTYENDGSFYPVNPPCNFQDIQLANNAQEQDMNQQLDLENVSVNFEQFLIQTKERYKGKKLVINDKIIEIE